MFVRHIVFVNALVLIQNHSVIYLTLLEKCLILICKKHYVKNNDKSILTQNESYRIWSNVLMLSRTLRKERAKSD